MEHQRIFILGSSLLTAGLARLLGKEPDIEVVGTAVTMDEALPLIDGHLIDVLIVMGTDDQATIRFCQILAKYPYIPIMHADISQNTVQLITSRNIQADPNEFMAALAALPRRS